MICFYTIIYIFQIIIKMANSKFSILYVDDEKNNLLIFKDTFRRNYNIYVATSAKEGAEILKNKKIDIILSDQRMPDVSGVDFFKQTLKEYPNINRILITGYTDFKAIKSAINDAKIYQYIQKPWREDDLSATINEALKIYQLEKDNKELSEKLKLANLKLEKTNAELIKSSNKIRKEKEKADESNRLKSVFLSSLSHEIRTPINGIIGFSRFLKQEDRNFAQRVEYTDIIIRSSKKLLKIIDDIVEISRFETKQVKIKFSEFNINTFFNDLFAIYNCKNTSSSLDITISNNIPKEKCFVVSDETKLQKITSNLIENAIRYTENGFVKIVYNIEKDDLIVKNKDSGIGIAPEMQTIIFERFRQEDENMSRSFDGLGLGLAIVKENIKILNGTINVKSEKGKGSIFTFKIPIKNKAEKLDNKKSDLDILKNSQKRFKVLIAEDRKLNYILLKSFLDNSKYNVEILRATNGEKAVDIFKKSQDFDIVFMDLKMPVLSGFEATKQIKSINKNIPIIAQTAFTSFEEKARAKKAGCSHFLEKPINFDILSKILDNYLKP